VSSKALIESTCFCYVRGMLLLERANVQHRADVCRLKSIICATSDRDQYIVGDLRRYMLLFSDLWKLISPKVNCKIIKNFLIQFSSLYLFTRGGSIIVEDILYVIRLLYLYKSRKLSFDFVVYTKIFNYSINQNITKLYNVI